MRVQPEPTISPSRRLHLKVLLPICVGLVFILFAGFAAYQLQYQNSIDRYSENQANLFSAEFRGEIDYRYGVLEATHKLLLENEELLPAFRAKDTTRLYDLSLPIFNRLRDTVDITHFYFFDVDRVNLLRVHAPSRSGDRIDRQTLLAAEQSDQLAVGIDLGPLGTLTLRAVMPWFDVSGDKIGYLELGIDVEHILSEIARQNDFGIALAIPKADLQQELWAVGNQYFEGIGEWDRYNNYVMGREHWLSKQQYQNLPDLDLFTDQQTPVEGDTTEHQHYYWSQYPVYDLQGAEIGKAILAIDVTDLSQFAESVAVQISVVYGVVALALVYLIYTYISRTEKAETELQTTIDKLEQLATFDQLTGLPNRYLFVTELDQRLREAERFNHEVGLAFIDLDNFKFVNDSWGHRVGDDLLQIVASRMNQVVRDYDLLARFGGDEFVLMMPQTNRDQATIIAQKLNQAFAEPIKLADKSFQVSLSIGVSIFPVDSDSRDSLLQHADIAMYRAKEDGKACCRLFSKDMKVEIEKRKKSEARLHLVT